MNNLIKGCLSALAIYVVLGLIAHKVWGAPPYDAVASVTNPASGAGGTATLVTPNALVTCYHIWREGGQTLDILFPATGERVIGTLVAVDQLHDLSAVSITTAVHVQPAPVAAAAKADGPFIMVGFPYYSRETITWAKADYLGYPMQPSNSVSFDTTDTLNITALADSGQSGGALFNNRGQLCGVTFGNVGDNDPQTGQMIERNAVATSGQSLVNFVNTQCARCPRVIPYGPQQPQQHQIIGNPPPLGVIQQPPPENIQPVQQPPQPTPPQQSPGLTEDKIQQMIDAAVAKLPPPAKGDPGEPGQPGRPGMNAEVDYDQLSSQVAAKVVVPPITISPPKVDYQQVAAAVPPIHVRANPNEQWQEVKPGQYLDLSLRRDAQKP